MNDIIPFEFEGAAVRAVDRDGEPWFVAKDIASILQYANTRKAVSDHCKRAMSAGEAGVTDRYPLDPQTILIPERDLYRLIMRSKLPSAERFEEWVCGDVIPSIRKTGSYGYPHTDPIQVLNDPAAMRGLLLTYSEKVLALESQVSDLQPKAEALDRIATADGSLCVTAAAKALQVRPKDLFTYLRAHRWIYRRPGGAELGYQERVNAGDIEHKVTTVLRADGAEKIVEQVRITPKGLAKLAKLMSPPLLAVA